MTLTAAGEILVRHICDTFRDMHLTSLLIEDLKGLRRGEVVLAMMSGLAANIVPRTALQFRRTNPGFDFAKRPNIRVLAVVLARLGGVLTPDHPLTVRTSLRVSECVEHPLVLADRSSAIRWHPDKMTMPRSQPQRRDCCSPYPRWGRMLIPVGATRHLKSGASTARSRRASL